MCVYNAHIYDQSVQSYVNSVRNGYIEYFISPFNTKDFLKSYSVDKSSLIRLEHNMSSSTVEMW